MDTGLVQIGGSPGGGIIMLFSPTINIAGTITARGNDASGGGYAAAGAGAGGSVLVKGDTISINNIDVRGGAQSAQTGGWNTVGGAGGNGGIAVYYKTSQSVTTTNSVGYNNYSDTVLTRPSYPILGGMC
jgi:hypothetical protein